MLKKSIKYVDFNGEEQIDECYFNLSKTELTQMEASEKGGFENYLTQLIEEKDQKKIFELFKEIVLMSYGQKSADGRQFIKKKMVDGQMIRLRDEFEQSVAFDELMMELIAGGDKAVSEFVSKLIPREIAAEIEKQMTDNTLTLPTNN